MLRLALLLLLSALAGCASTRVQVEPAPTASAPLTDRQTYYQKHRPVGAERKTTSMGFASQLGTPITEEKVMETGVLELNDGTRVLEDEDVLPAVDANSPTAQAIRESVTARAAYYGWSYGACGIMLGTCPVSLATGGGTLVVARSLPVALGATMVTTLVGFAASAFAMWTSVRFNEEETQARERAYQSYDADLRRRLDLPPDATPPIARTRY